MRCLMIDLETLSTRLDARLLSAGAVIFDRTAPYFAHGPDLLEAVFDINAQDGHIDGETIRWWMGKSEEARGVFTSPNVRRRPLRDMWDWFLLQGQLGIDEVWSKGANFDIAILEFLGAINGWPLPWSYKTTRCVRTLEALFPVERIPMEGHAHNALDDAIDQARTVWRISRQYGVK